MKKLGVIMAAVLLAGCSNVNISYDGESRAPVAQAVLVDKAPAGAVLLGRAKASGPATRVDRSEMVKSLLDEAKEVGADAVVITDYQVTPEREENRLFNESSRQVWTGENAETANWTPMMRDFSGGYGKVDFSSLTGGNSAAGPVVIHNYIRVIYADFYAD